MSQGNITLLIMCGTFVIVVMIVVGTAVYLLHREGNEVRGIAPETSPLMKDKHQL